MNSVSGQAERDLLVKRDHEHLILRIAGAGKRQGSCNNFRPLRPHASAVVDDQSDGYRDIFVTERVDLLRDSVFENQKVLLIESRNKRSFGIQHGCVQNHHANFYRNRELIRLAAG